MDGYVKMAKIEFCFLLEIKGRLFKNKTNEDERYTNEMRN